MSEAAKCQAKGERNTRQKLISHAEAAKAHEVPYEKVWKCIGSVPCSCDVYSASIRSAVDVAAHESLQVYDKVNKDRFYSPPDCMIRLILQYSSLDWNRVGMRSR